ncbi:hypothetical protein ACW14Y_00325 [Kitasatospora sp. cg17-2]
MSTASARHRPHLGRTALRPQGPSGRHPVHVVPDDLSAHKNWHIAGGPGDHFLHRIDLRPAARTRELDVLRQGPNPWA